MKAHKTLSPSARRGAAGFVLLEALVGILIFAFGVLGLVGLQASMTKAQTAAKFRGDASYLASEVMGSMWADIPNLANYDTAANCATHARCKAWTDKVAVVLPGGTAVILIKPAGVVEITITWSAPNEGTHTFVTATSIAT
jgi:type IV pilus assembly protein PilV